MSSPIFKCSEGRNESGRSRPYLAKHDYLFQQNYRAYKIRQFVKPGVTGPAMQRVTWRIYGFRVGKTDDRIRFRLCWKLDFVDGCGNCSPHNWTGYFSSKICLLKIIFSPNNK